MSEIKLYNTPARRLETFRPEHPDIVKLYTCGPTVYSQPHIGNYASYIYWDLLVRMLGASGYPVRRVINLTDVGHLTSDADDGEDKMEKGARLSGQTVWDVAQHYIDVFQADYRSLGLVEPAVWARATDYIPEDIAIVDTLTAKGYTYETADGIYFDTSKFAHYADFANLDLDHLKAGARVEFSDEKKHPSDFAVWKFIQPGERHAMRWDYLGRPGYPGWHLECSTIIHSELGEPIDIHTGGIDHIPVHHTNEIAQSESAFERRLAKYWLHCDFITVDGQKISKSLGNIYSIADLVTKGFSPFDFKLWVLQGHYRSERDFTFASLEAARVRRLNWRNQIARLYQTAPAQQPQTSLADQDQAAYATVLAAVQDDLNSPRAFAAIDAAGAVSLAFWQQIDELFGLNLLADAPRLAPAQQDLLARRAAARSACDYAASDALRDQLLATGIAVLDTPDGQIWQYNA